MVKKKIIILPGILHGILPGILRGILPMLLISAPLFAQVERGNEKYWFSLERGKSSFRGGDFGNALLLFEDARNQRRALFFRAERVLVDLLSLGEVRRYNDNLDRVEQYITERNLFDAREALDELYYRVKREDLRNSAAGAIAEIRRLRDYPEADYWAAEVHRFEGELGLAAGEYRSAYTHRANLENAGFATTILYRLAETEHIRGNFAAFESSLFEILKQDTLWTSDPDSFARRAMKRTLENEGLNRFLTMYRYKNSDTERAHRLLGEYYYRDGDWARAEEHFAFAFLSATTTVIDEVKKNKYDWTWTNLNTLMAGLERRDDLRQFLNDVEYYRTIYLLGAALSLNAKPAAGRDFWDFLAAWTPNSEWGERASRELQTAGRGRAVSLVR
jgi:hypothetical protein